MVPRRAESLACALMGSAGLVMVIATPHLIAGHNPDQPYYLQSAFFPWLALTIVCVFGFVGAFQAFAGVERVQSDEIESGDSSVALGVLGMIIFGLSVLVSLTFGYAVCVWASAMALGLLARLSLKMCVFISSTLAAALYGIFVMGFKVWFPSAWILS
jgi:hypothetical protein